MTAKALCKQIASGKWKGAPIVPALRDAAKQAK